MSARPGNINAEKWNLGNVEWLLHEIEDIMDDPDIILLSHALIRCNAYTKLWWRLKRKFILNEDIIHRMEVIEEFFEVKIMHGVLVGRYREKAARLVLERNARYGACETKEEIESGVPNEMVAAVEEELGELSTEHREGSKRRKLLVHVYGKTMAQLIEEGYHFYDQTIYGPDEKGFIEDGEWIPCELADGESWCRECSDCREAA